MTNLVGQQFGKYRLTRFLDDGGFAEVYLGEHKELGTQAAIKVLKTSLPQTEEKKFRTEATTIAKLIHPHIVRVFDFGVRGTIPFMVMDYAPNGTLRQLHPSGTQVSLNTIVSYVKQVAEALQYAHDSKIIHRDVKPANMLIGRLNEIWLSDFGIAVLAHSTHSMIIQDKVGTLAYMAPEQLQGKPTIASDQYALGVVVYEWICGEVPFTGTELEILTQHLSVTPPSLRVKVPTISSNIEQVVLKALSKDPQQRFPSVQKFAQILEQAYLSKQTINLPASSNPPPLPLPPTMPVVLPPPASLGTLLCTYRGHISGVAHLIWSPDGFYIASIGNDQAIQVWNATTGNSIITPSQSGSRNLLLGRIASWSPYGQYIAIGSGNNSISILEFATEDTRIIYHNYTPPIEALTWTQDGQHIISTDGKGTTHVLNAISGDKEIAFSGNSSLSPDGTRIASIGNDYTVQIWNLFTRSKIFTFRGHTKKVVCFAWSPDGTKIASGSNDGTLRTWDTVVGGSFILHKGLGNIEALAWSPNGELIAVVQSYISGLIRRDYYLQVFSSDFKRGSLSGSLHEGTENTDDIVWSSEKSVILWSKGGKVSIWNTSSGHRIFDYYGHGSLSPDKQRIATASEDKTLQIWGARTGQHIFTYHGHPGKVIALAWSPDGTRIASATDGSMIHVWQAI